MLDESLVVLPSAPWFQLTYKPEAFSETFRFCAPTATTWLCRNVQVEANRNALRSSLTTTGQACKRVSYLFSTSLILLQPELLCGDPKIT